MQKSDDRHTVRLAEHEFPVPPAAQEAHLEVLNPRPKPGVRGNRFIWLLSPWNIGGSPNPLAINLDLKAVLARLEINASD